MRIICALTLPLFLEIHKVCLQKSAFIRAQILSKIALADLSSFTEMKNNMKVVEKYAGI